MKNLFNNRRFKHGSMATAMTILFIVGVVIVNIIVSLLLARFPVKVDLTEGKLFQLTQESVDYTKKINQEVNITVCTEEQTLADSSANGQPFGKQAVELINGYAANNTKINVKYVSLLKEPAISQKYIDYNITDYSVILETDKRTKVVNINDFIESQTNQQTQQQTYRSKAEQVMTSALMYVTDEKVLSASVLTGHTEVGCAGFTSMLTANNYEVSEQNIVTEDVNPEASLAVIYAPTTDYTTEEIKKLETFLDNDGKFDKTMVYIASANQPVLPNLEAFLNDWGIAVGNELLAETDNTNIYNRVPYNFAVNYDDADYTKDLRQKELPYLVFASRPLTATFSEADNRTAKVLLSSPDTTIAMPLSEDAEFDINSAEKASYGVAVLGQKVKYDGTTPHTSSVLAFGSTENFNQSLISNANFNNNEYSINAVNKLAGKEDSLNIASVSFDAKQLTVTQAQANTIMVIFVVAVPLLMVILGIVIWLRRRNK